MTTLRYNVYPIREPPSVDGPRSGDPADRSGPTRCEGCGRMFWSWDLSRCRSCDVCVPPRGQVHTVRKNFPITETTRRVKRRRDDMATNQPEGLTGHATRPAGATRAGASLPSMGITARSTGPGRAEGDGGSTDTTDLTVARRPVTYERATRHPTAYTRGK